ncbi:MAG TPA: c-type cytochrome [Actinomycetota bacterium]|nr:c-type cytochrome [Actinomycetota bacterium]
MTTAQVLTLILVVIVPAALLWAIFIARTGRPGAPRRPRIGIPHALRPGQPDEVLEGPRLDRLLVWGWITTIVAAAFIPAYWLPERTRQAAFQERFDHEAVERGELIFQVAPPLDEEASAAEFKEEEKAISLGQGCANCHGGDASGGLSQPAYVDPTTAGGAVAYRAPPLNNVFQRWDEEVVRFTIERGRPGTPMPAWGVEYGGSMTEQMITDVIAWLKTLPGNQEAPPPISDACETPNQSQFMSCGAEIFEARCAVCHGPQGQGKEAKGTDPTLDFNNSGPDEISDPWYQGMALWNGDVRHLSRSQHLFTVRNGRRFAFMPPFAAAPAAGIPAPLYPLTDEQIEAVVAYERSL